MALAYTTSPAYHLIAEDDDGKAAAMFDEGHYMQVEVAAMTATSDQPELAREFLRFMLTDGFQGVIPTTNWMYPAHTPAVGPARGLRDAGGAGEAAALLAGGGAGEARRGAGGMAGGAQPIAAARPLGRRAGAGAGRGADARDRRRAPARGPSPAAGSGRRSGRRCASRWCRRCSRRRLSCLFAVPAARALARRRFPGRGAMVALLGAPFLLPAIVAVFGIVAIWGRAGLVSRGLEALGLPGLDVYGLRGVVLAHVFFNVALVARLVLQGWLAIPAEQFRLAAQLGFAPRGRLPPHRGADAARGAAGRVRAGVPALHDELRGGADPRRRAAGDHGRARHLPGGALRLRPRAGGVAGADPVRALRRRDAAGAALLRPRRLRRRRLGGACGAGTRTAPGYGRSTAACWRRWRSSSGCRWRRWCCAGGRRSPRACRRRSGRRRAEPRRGARLGGAGAGARAGARGAGRRAAGAGRRAVDRGGRADDAGGLALRDRHRALHPALSRWPIPSRWRCR